MALKATIHKASLNISDIDRNLYSDHNLTLARHPSETDERMMIRLLAFALNAPPNNDQGLLEFGKDMWEPDEPCLVQKDLTGLLVHVIEVGQPDEKRITRLCSRAARVSVYSFSSSTATWWSGIAGKLTRLRNLTVWQVPAEQSQQLAAMCKRSMSLQLTLQDGALWVGDGTDSVEITLSCLYGNPDA
ncbi:uncharacterized protein YaeQ [Prosthecobacter fusiformis]|uniref:Uncharacterized protein YaeQ n=1 Tax=Prosthecobacter fusiformis TaxID=48464 RepID=A0A4R7RYL3_9BACT|nr:YaeQ family protein [Prosthecobacter fusiformis]TDU70972.1 uncharacterized protein YaeQ [Prosthecobacter fusiformis]